MRYRVPHRSAAARPGLTQVLGSGPKSSVVCSRNLIALACPGAFGRCHIKSGLRLDQVKFSRPRSRFRGRLRMVEPSPLIVPGLRNVIASAALSPEEIPRNMAAPLTTVHCLTMRSSRDRFAARLMRYRVAQSRPRSGPA